MANLVETAKHYGGIVEKKFDDWLISGCYLVFGYRADLARAEGGGAYAADRRAEEHEAKVREIIFIFSSVAAANDDPAYIISGSAFRMKLVGDLFDLLAQSGFIRNRVLEVKTERQLARMQKNVSGEHPAIRGCIAGGGSPRTNTGVTSFDMLEKLPIRQDAH